MAACGLSTKRSLLKVWFSTGTARPARHRLGPKSVGTYRLGLERPSAFPLNAIPRLATPLDKGIRT